MYILCVAHNDGLCKKHVINLNTGDLRNSKFLYMKMNKV